MALLTAYNFISLNGYFKGENGDISWAKRNDREQSEFAAKNMKAGNTLLFGRVTYEMMAAFWPTEQAEQVMPDVAAGMNKAKKIVFSKTLKKADWANTTIISNDIFEEVKKLKNTQKKDMTILGSGSIISQFAEKGLIDYYQIMIHPVVLSSGTPLLSNITINTDLKLKDSKIFKNGVVLLSYEPEKE
jgi:dihydrofolate reductase